MPLPWNPDRLRTSVRAAGTNSSTDLGGLKYAGQRGAGYAPVTAGDACGLAAAGFAGSDVLHPATNPTRASPTAARAIPGELLMNHLAKASARGTPATNEAHEGTAARRPVRRRANPNAKRFKWFKTSGDAHRQDGTGRFPHHVLCRRPEE